MKKTIILNHKQIAYKTKRIAYQIYENNINETEIIIAGIDKSGFLFAERIKKELDSISPILSTLCKVKMNKKNVLEPIHTSITENKYKDKSIVLVDDVLNSGATLIYAIKHFLQVPLKNFKTAVLVNRNHKKYPVKADFKGISLSTSLQEHITVEFKVNEDIAYLT